MVIHINNIILTIYAHTHDRYAIQARSILAAIPARPIPSAASQPRNPAKQVRGLVPTGTPDNGPHPRSTPTATQN